MPLASVARRAVLARPRERVGHGLLERPEAEPGGDGARHVGLEERDLLAGSSQSGSSIHVPTPSLEQELVGHPDELGVRARTTARHVSSSSPIVSRGSPVALKSPTIRCSATWTSHAPRSRASTNWTIRPGSPGREHLAAARDAHRPVGEPPGRIVRPDDQPGAHVRERAGEDLADDVLAPDLEPAVGLAGHLVGVLDERRSAAPTRRSPAGTGTS